MKSVELKKGRYYFNNGKCSASIFLKIYQKEYFILIAITLGIIIGTNIFWAIPYSFVLLILYNAIVILLLTNSIYFNSKLPKKITYDPVFFGFTIFFININFFRLLPLELVQFSIVFNTTKVYISNLILALCVLLYFMSRLIIYKLKKLRGEEAKKPVTSTLFYITSTFSILFSQISIISVVLFSFNIIYLINLVISIIFLLLVLVISILAKMKNRMKGIRNKTMKISFYSIMIILFLFLIGYIIIILNAIIFSYNAPIQNNFQNTWDGYSLLFNAIGWVLSALFSSLYIKKYGLFFNWKKFVEIETKLKSF